MINLVGAMVSHSAKLLIMIASVLFGFSIYKGNIYYQQNVNNIGFLFFVMAFEGYFIGSLFVNLFLTTYDTIVVCYQVELNVEEFCGIAVNKCPDELRDVLGRISQLGPTNYRKLN